MKPQVRDCYFGAPNTEDVGVCHGGTQFCKDDNLWNPKCSGQVLPAPEQCNGGDDNCDGQAEPMLAAPVKVGSGKWPRLINHKGQLVAAWLDPFNKFIFQKLAPDGTKIGSPVPVLPNATLADFEIVSYAGGIGLVTAKYSGIYKSYVAYAQTLDADFAPVAPEQRLGLVPPEGLQTSDLLVEPLGGGSSQYLVIEMTKFNQNTARVVVMPQGNPGDPVPTTVLVSGFQSGADKVRLFSTDYGAVALHPSGTKYQMYGFGPVGNQVWSVGTPQFFNLFASYYNGDDFAVVGSVGASNFRHLRISATDGMTLESGGPVAGALATAVNWSYFGGIYASGSYHMYACFDQQLTHMRFAKNGAFVPYEAKVGPVGECGDKNNPHITEMRLAVTGGKVVMLRNDNTDVYFVGQLCQ